MEKKFLKNHIKEAENFNIKETESLKDDYISFSEMQELTKTATRELYFSACKYNQNAVLKRFIELLHNKFNDSLYISKKYFESIRIYLRNVISKDNSFITLRSISSFGCHFTFIINDYIYYIQFDDNPFFEGSSYITTKKIYQFDNDIIYNNLKNKYFLKEYYAGAQKLFNINDCIDDLYSVNCDIEKSALNLFNYFMNCCYENESLRAHSKNERISVLNGEKNSLNIYNIVGNEYF